VASSSDEFTAAISAKRDEVAAELDVAVAELAPARAAVAAAKEVAWRAGARFGTIGLRCTRAVRSAGTIAPALQQIVDEARQVCDRADSQATLAKALLANIEWRVSCLRDDLDQLDRLLHPGPIEGGPRVEVVKRAPPGPTEVEIITFPAGHPAGEAA
jgi:hypothetical protein